MGLGYRTLQFLRNLRDKPTNSQLRLVDAHLPAALQRLFARMSPADQAHSLRVCQALIDQGHTDPDLLAAALLHDVGKSMVPPNVLERVFIVLANQIMPRQVFIWGQAEPRGWKRASVIARQHPGWGADLVAENDGSELTVRLIRHHQADLDPQHGEDFNRKLSLLRAADNQN